MRGGPWVEHRAKDTWVVGDNRRRNIAVSAIERIARPFLRASRVAVASIGLKSESANSGNRKARTTNAAMTTPWVYIQWKRLVAIC